LRREIFKALSTSRFLGRTLLIQLIQDPPKDLRNPNEQARGFKIKGSDGGFLVEEHFGQQLKVKKLNLFALKKT